MKRRDFLKAFSATTTIAAANTLANIVEAQPVIQTLEKSIILPGDDGFDLDWVFHHVGYLKHEYDGGSLFDFGLLIKDDYFEASTTAGKDEFHFGFSFKEDDFVDPSRVYSSPLPEHYQEFLEKTTFVADADNISIGGETGTDYYGLEISRATITW